MKNLTISCLSLLLSVCFINKTVAQSDRSNYGTKELAMVGKVSHDDYFSDKDADGVRDVDDECPEIKGLAINGGCPDSDNDGVIDIKDDCPTMIGIVNLHGCPDYDGDGITDRDDICPNEFGTVAHHGCPIVGEQVKPVKDATKIFEEAMYGIKFEISSEVLKQASYPVLEEVYYLLSENPQMKISISGHTDIIGEPEVNEMLSQMRADEVKNYLVNKGIEPNRLTAIGYGATKPIAPNNTSEGRAENRRVEIAVVN